MAECGRGGAAGGALPTSPGPALGAKGALKAGAGEGCGGGGGLLGHGRARYDSGGVSNGDCSLGVSGEEARASPARGPRGVALAPTPSPASCPHTRESKQGGLPRRSSIIKVGGRRALIAHPQPSLGSVSPFSSGGSGGGRGLKGSQLLTGIMMHGCLEWLNRDWMQMAFGKNGEVIPNVRGSCAHTSPAQLGAVTSPRIGLE
ncbi:Hypothetical predicted protein [Marmota monax]|uniref:Uncharacterized protein n=1 Tax=Marmota monax TaxID=9995 RepID=A0A5E4CY89_MARMO|nr:Hypothetical predicted protein [Marmota monax]